MQQLRRILPLLFIGSYIVSLFFYESAKAWLSISMFGILASVVFLNYPQKVWSLFWNNKPLLILSVTCLFLFLYIPLSYNMHYAWNRMEIKGPLLGLPIAFAFIGIIDKRWYHFFLTLYVFLCFATSLYTIYQFSFNYELVTEEYLKAKVMPSVVNHVRYSIMIAFGCYVSYYLYKIDFTFRFIRKELFLLIAFLLFVFLHVFSVRSGLVALYGMVVVELILYVIKTKRYVLSFFAGATLFLILTAAITFIPTLNNKWINTKTDIQTYLDKGYPNYNSLTTRFISYEAAIAIFKNEPLLGCGLGDIKDETDAYFKAHYPMIDIPILPHNQFLFYLSATGIIGLLTFCFTFYFPLFYNKNWQNKLLLMQYVVLTLSFMTEPMLETQLGMAYSILFILLPLTQKKEETI